MIVINTPLGVYSDIYSIQLDAGRKEWSLWIRRVGLSVGEDIPVMDLIPPKSSLDSWVPWVKFMIKEECNFHEELFFDCAYQSSKGVIGYCLNKYLYGLKNRYLDTELPSACIPTFKKPLPPSAAWGPLSSMQTTGHDKEKEEWYRGRAQTVGTVAL